MHRSRSSERSDEQRSRRLVALDVSRFALGDDAFTRRHAARHVAGLFLGPEATTALLDGDGIAHTGLGRPTARKQERQCDEGTARKLSRWLGRVRCEGPAETTKDERACVAESRGRGRGSHRLARLHQERGSRRARFQTRAVPDARGSRGQVRLLTRAGSRRARGPLFSARAVSRGSSPVAAFFEGSPQPALPRPPVPQPPRPLPLFEWPRAGRPCRRGLRLA